MKQKGRDIYTVQRLFADYCNWRYSEVKDNEKFFNYCSEQFAKTELFQFSTIETENIEYDSKVFIPSKDYTKILVANYDSYSLPFERQFIKVAQSNTTISSIFIGEFKPKVITGTIVTTYIETGAYVCIGFSIDENGELNAQFTKEMAEDEDNLVTLMHYVMSVLSLTLKTLNALGKHAVIKDTPTNTVQYYRRKHAPSLKVIDRPIYYVLDKKYKEGYKFAIKNPIGKLSYTHTFKVRGHWRTLKDRKTLGKDREGNRKVEGYTWVTEYLKGEGELVKRIRIIK